MDLGIAGKTVLITGGSSGIGAATARAFANEGCKVICVARQKDRLEQLIADLGGSKAGHGYLDADLLEPDQTVIVIKSLLAQFVSFDIVVHNVGGALGVKDPLAEASQWQKVWHFNAGISIAINNILIPLMKQKRWGRVVHISSISGAIGEPLLSPFGGALPYAAAKAYLNAYVQGLGRELAQHNIVVCALLPAAVLSEGKYWDKVSKQDPELARSFLERHHSIRRFGKPEEIASFATFMASQHAAFACGALIPIDGGRV